MTNVQWCAQWLRDNYQDHPNIDSLCHAMLAAAPQQQVEPVWIQPDHLQKARVSPFLCRVEPKRRDDFVPLYASPRITAGLALTDDMVEAAADAWFATRQAAANKQGVELKDVKLDFGTSFKAAWHAALDALKGE